MTLGGLLAGSTGEPTRVAPTIWRLQGRGSDADSSVRERRTTIQICLMEFL